VNFQQLLGELGLRLDVSEIHIESTSLLSWGFQLRRFPISLIRRSFCC